MDWLMRRRRTGTGRITTAWIRTLLAVGRGGVTGYGVLRRLFVLGCRRARDGIG